ncbi:leucine-rich repeat extensin-like protein 7 [Iris pallida]|uniref:Leucine-rich repeat extensin-like protein 7 n=1 Tax=Iris pallida TaxID=29817 RepID=A0AAX6F7U6_IRIPA|nr:leucine-rich repeat extensin-like protein 7 [Iris pallida]
MALYREAVSRGPTRVAGSWLHDDGRYVVAGVSFFWVLVRLGVALLVAAGNGGDSLAGIGCRFRPMVVGMYLFSWGGVTAIRRCRFVGGRGQEWVVDWSGNGGGGSQGCCGIGLSGSSCRECPTRQR